jgi:hypothetical protein
MNLGLFSQSYRDTDTDIGFDFISIFMQNYARLLHSFLLHSSGNKMQTECAQ